MGKTKKDIKIIKKDSNNENYTFVGENDVLTNLQNESNNEKSQKINLMRELKKRFLQRK